MIEKIKELEALSKQLDPDATKREEWLKAVQAYANEFLDSIEDRPAFHESDNKGQGISKIDIEDQPKEMDDLLKAIDQWVDRPALNAASGGHLAYIPGGGLFPSALGDFLADISNNYAGIYFGGPGAVRMENKLLRWMCSLVHYPETALGNLTSGGSIANLIAIATARDRKKILAEGIQNAVIYLTHQAHHSCQKAIRIAGLGECIHRYIPTDQRFRMDVRALEEQLKNDKKEGLRPFLIIGSAGTTDTGAIDPMKKMALLAREHDCWFHVDAAYGGFFILLDELEASFEGIELSDSVTIDPHKGLFLPYGSGAVLIKDVKALRDTHYYQANYMQDAIPESNEPSPADLSPELTKHFRGLRMWLPLQLFGLAPFKAALSEKILLCRFFYKEVQKLGFEVGPYPELSVMIYRYHSESGDSNEINRQIIQMVRKDGRVFLSSTTIDSQVWLRLAVLSFRTHLDTIQTALTVLKGVVESLTPEKN
ncbi:MAG TPA: aminotransferase class I/II-fold pyridoxal phosphate-dependent enzyme [Saprospiraceae bacterium]|nr:aminotransferase class I/II-fold pyridoxal phosphate-dependent enzyme [Saprospiraceae bacterium]